MAKKSFGAYSLTASNNSAPLDEPGAERVDELTGKKYRYYKNTSGGTLNSGDVGVFDDAETNGYSVKTTTTANDPGVAGVCVAGTLTDDYYGWFQTHGYNAAVKVKGASSTVTARDALGTHTTAKRAVTTTTAGAKFAIAMDGSTADEAIAAILMCGV